MRAANGIDTLMDDDHPGVAPPPLPRAPDDERTRQIIDAAYALLGESGLEGLTIRAVLGRTGLARRAFYERFAVKDELVLALFEHVIHLAAAHYAIEVQRWADPLDQLRTVINAIALGGLVDDDAGIEPNNRHAVAMSREHLRLAETRPADLQRALRPLLDLIAQLLADGMAAGTIRVSSPHRMASLVYNLVATTVHAEFLSEDSGADRARRSELAEDVWQFCRLGISAQSAR